MQPHALEGHSDRSNTDTNNKTKDHNNNNREACLHLCSGHSYLHHYKPSPRGSNLGVASSRERNRDNMTSRTSVVSIRDIKDGRD